MTGNVIGQIIPSCKIQEIFYIFNDAHFWSRLCLPDFPEGNGF